MKKNFLYLLKGLVLSLLILSLLFGINQIESPKYFYDNTWPTSATYAGFYQLPKDSIDVLFFGSSHAAAGFIPQELYNNYGITSYNLGCEQQNLLCLILLVERSIAYSESQSGHSGHLYASYLYQR